MNVDHFTTVSHRLDEFLSHPTKRVLLLKGKWGVGKTHYWTKAYLPSRLRQAGDIKERLYAYVSLFGVESVDDLEQLILVSSVKTGDKKALHYVETGIRKAASIAELIPVLKDYQGLVRRIGHMAIRNTLICMDEIERKAAGLSLSAVMGIISVLREHNGCRFVLIMNDEHVAGDDARDLAQYREKVIDETVTYAPDVADNARLIFGNDPMFSLYASVFRRIGVGNIRVMQQAAWALEHFAPHMSALEQAMKQQFQEHIVMLSAFFHLPALGIDVSKLPRESLMEYYFQKEDDESPEHKREMEAARRYGYEIQEYDHIIVDYLKNGRCNKELLGSLLEEANLREQHGRFQNEFRQMWTPYNRSFKASTAEVATSIATFLNQHAENVSFSQLWEILKLADSLGLRSKRKKWIDAWIAPRITTGDLKRLREFTKYCTSRRLKDEIRKRENLLTRKVSISQLIIEVAKKSGWNPEMVRQLGSFDANDFRWEFTRHDEDNYLAALHNFCDSWKSAGADEQVVEKKVEDALLSMAKSGKLNQLRVRMIIPWAFPNSGGNAAGATPTIPDIEDDT